MNTPNTTTTEREKKTHLPLTGRRYSSVDEFLVGEAVSVDVRSAVSKLDRESSIVDGLIQARRDAGLTQQEMAEKIGKSQGAVSKLESSSDNEIKLEELAAYARATGQNFVVMVGKPMNHIESVKYHAFGIKEHLSKLAKEAHRNEEVEQAVQAFFGEAFFNILTILSKCSDEMPNGNGIQVRMKKVGRPCKASLANETAST
ncbi:MAG: helix-turn-helix transcriptional regulator [Verrucomicrobiota bacterium]